jgi:outer membrane protein assembly factor BamA
MTSKSRVRIVLTLLWLLITLAVIGQDPPTQQFRLSKVNFKGLEHITQEQAMEAGGLSIGDKITLDSIEVAAQKLMDSGLFGNLSYRIRSVKTDATVEFEVEERKGSLPVVFDNFVWFSDQELFNAVKAEIPSFNGTTPDAGRSTDTIKKVLTRLLRVANVNGDVQYMLAEGGPGGGLKHVFSVTGVKVPVCEVHFSGARAIKEQILVDKSKVLFENDFSREASSTFPPFGLLPLYRQVGRLRAQINFDSAKLVESDNCKNGVALNYIIDEGDIYTWAGSEWAGNTTLPADVLTKTIGMKQGEVADGLKIDTGIEKVRDEYGKRGYVALRIKSSPTFQDQERSVSYRFAISEGPQYKMGNLIFKGIPDSEANRLRPQWKLRSGEIYDSSYQELFLRLIQRSATVNTILNKEKLTVDVELELS